jgi:essential nuclear protein 1
MVNSRHVKVKSKDIALKRKIKEPKETLQAPQDLVDAEGFVCLPSSQELPEELEAELQEFRRNRVTFAKEIKEKLKDTSVMDPKVTEVYGNIGKLLKTFRSGKVPKAFKIIPGLEHWEKILELTKPDEWSPQAMYEATKIFISSMGPKQAQVFIENYLYAAVRNNILKYKKLNYHYYKSLKKALYKPAAWIKGILLKICTEEDCTLKEASIIGSVLSKMSLPMLHASAALIKLSEIEYSGPTSYFIRVLLNKKYSLPIRVVDAISEHFLRFTLDERKMPVLWHQALLTFVSLYGKQARARHDFKELLKAHNHPSITAEIRNKLYQES